MLVYANIAFVYLCVKLIIKCCLYDSFHFFSMVFANVTNQKMIKCVTCDGKDFFENVCNL